MGSVTRNDAAARVLSYPDGGMRCPFCGTENAPDSRFCGGCGQAQPAPGPVSRVAPTAKIPDDAPLAPPTRPGPSGVHSPHVSYAPPAMPTPPPGSLQAPPQLQSPASIAPTVQRQPPRAASVAPPPRAPMASNASMDFAPPPHRPLGLIAFVLILDLALAGSGAFLLLKGLSKAPAPVTQTSKP